MTGLDRGRALDGPIDLLLTDVEMPGPRGPELAARLAVTRPATRVIFMSGYAASGPAAMPPGAAFLQKPFTPQALLLLALVEATLDRAR